MNLTSKQEQLAIELAHALDDMDSLRVHRMLVTMYSEEHLRKKLAKVLSIPVEKIRKSRGALFMTLVRGYGSTRD